MRPALTVGMATHSDFEGVFFSTQALWLYHALDRPDVELVIVDNSPDSEHGHAITSTLGWLNGKLFQAGHALAEQVRMRDWALYGELLAKAGGNPASFGPYLATLVKSDAEPRGQVRKIRTDPAYAQAVAEIDRRRWPCKYVPFTAVQGTSVPRNQVFEHASGEAVLCMDCHVLLWPGAIDRLLAYYAAHPDCMDLLSGPLVYDDLESVSTHFDLFWREGMWGTWGTDPRGVNVDAPPFEIPAQGLGLFSCRKDAWLGFNNACRGFGGEEGYIHTKYRQAGRKTLCLPFLRWVHRFHRIGGTKYPATEWNKVRNYVIEFTELGLSLDPIYRHFVQNLNDDGRTRGDHAGGAMPAFPQHEWDQLAAVPHNPPEMPLGVKGSFTVQPPCTNCGGGVPETVTLEQLYEAAAKKPSDFEEHVPKLRELATGCEHVVCFGGRDLVSTVAALAGKPRRLTVYDPQPSPALESLGKRPDLGTVLRHVRERSEAVTLEEPAELLYVCTRHTASQFYAELSRHAGNVTRRICFNGSSIFGETGEDGGPGLLPALRRFVREFPEWSVIYHTEANYGFSVISRDPADKPELPSTARQVWNFGKAMAKYAASGKQLLPESEVEKRLDVCSLCTMRVEERCSKCGCYLVEGAADAPGKALLLTEECPLGLWPLPLVQEDAA